LIHGDGSSGGDAASNINPNIINASALNSNRRSSERGSGLNIKGSNVMFKDATNDNSNRVSTLKPSASDFFVISEQKLKMKLGIRRESVTPE
jgi:hypothetical protein